VCHFNVEKRFTSSDEAGVNSMKTAVALLICFSAIVSTTHLGAQESPSADGFPRTLPSLKAPKIELTPNEQELLVRTDKSHEQAAERVKEYLQT
jgi:hypothetical protein